MISTTVGDMAQHLMLRRVGTGLKRAVTDLSQELTNGLVSDQARRVSGEFSVLADITHRLALAETHRDLARTAGTRLAVQQTVIEGLQAHAQAGLAELALAEQSPMAAQVARGFSQMETRFGDAVTQLNTVFGGVGLFSGASSNGAALAGASHILDQLMADLGANLAPNPTALETSQFIDGWFAPGGAFDTVGYLGDTAVSSRLSLGNGLDVGFEITAENMEIRATLAALAKGAALARGALAGNERQQAAMVRELIADLATADVGLVDIGARIGQEEWRAAEAVTRAEAELYAMKIARSEMLNADSYDTATQLELARTQLDLIYAMTARLSRLSLLEYLR